MPFQSHLLLQQVFQRILDLKRGWIFILALFLCRHFPLVVLYVNHSVINNYL